MPRSHGFRVKSRKLMRKREGKRGFTSRLLLLQGLQEGDKVAIHIDPSFHKGMPHRRYHGKIATVLDRRGRAFEVETTKGKKRVTLTIRAEHLRRL
ncbi:MAG: 50S ribosomal protein L21e [Candidatus Geothermarchaeales archaeon]